MASWPVCLDWSSSFFVTFENTKQQNPHVCFVVFTNRGTVSVSLTKLCSVWFHSWQSMAEEMVYLKHFSFVSWTKIKVYCVALVNLVIETDWHGSSFYTLSKITARFRMYYYGKYILCLTSHIHEKKSRIKESHINKSTFNQNTPKSKATK